MSRKNGKYENHDFYCLSCGQKTIPIMRKSGHKHEQFHRKKLYCYNCRATCNCIEITSFSEKEQFLQNFREGKYIAEAEQSKVFCSNER